MAYKHYLLGCLADEPMSGYSLYKHLFAPFRRPLSQIYRTLNKMTEEGLLEVERVVQDKLPNQNVYSVTEAGRAELMRWLKQPETVAFEQMEVLGRLWLGSKVDKKDVTKHLEAFAKRAREQFEYFKDKVYPLVEARAKERGCTVADFYHMLTLDFTIQQYGVAVEWAEMALEKIESLRPEDGKTGQAGAAELMSTQELISVSLDNDGR